MPFDPDSPSSRGVATRQRIGADLVIVVPTWTEAIDYALDALLGVGRPDRLAFGVVDLENAGHGRIVQFLGYCGSDGLF
jgi:hypothetical protein